MMVPMIILVISFFLDGILTNFLPYTVGDLSLFTPMITIVALVIVYPFFVKRLRFYFITCFVTGIVYDFFYTNLLFYNAILFLGIGCITLLLERFVRRNWLSVLLFIFVAIVGYECMNAVIILIFQLVPMNFERLFYKITHSLLLNLCYGEILYFIIWLLPERFKKISLNS